VASVSATAEGVKFLLIRHPGALITVSPHVADISVKKGDAVSRGQSIARVASGSPSFLHFEVRKGFESTDPMPYLR
jgi:murein DD-endopeptidase MepM/ murein hydrolase activator NlpD